MSLRITAAYASIAQLTIYLNLPVDVPLRLGMTRARRKLGRELRAEERTKFERGEITISPDDVPVDRLPIRMANVKFKYATAHAEVDEAEEAKKAEAAVHSGWMSTMYHGKLVEFDDDNDGAAEKKITEASEAAEATAATAIKPAVEDIKLKARSRFRMLRESLELTADKQERKKQQMAEDGNLDGVELELEQGKVVAIVGAPNQGKATIMRFEVAKIRHLVWCLFKSTTRYG